MKQSTNPVLLLFISAVIFCVPGLGQSKATASAPATDNSAAVVNGRTISQAEVDNTIFSQLFALRQQIYAIRKVALENVIARALLDEEANRKGISVEELKQQLTAGRVAVPASQVEELYAETASAFGAMSPDEAKTRLRLDLENQARMKNYREALSKLKEAAQIRRLLEEPRLPTISDLNAPSTGAREARVTIVEFSDFQCPFCKSSQGVIKEVLKRYPSDVRWIFKHLPLENHAEAFMSAQAAFCAGEQGVFWQYHDALFVAEDISSESLAKLAANLHLDLPKFKDCSKSEASRFAVQMDLDEAKRFGIVSTPTFVINGRLFRGALSFEDFTAAIDQELKSHR